MPTQLIQTDRQTFHFPIQSRVIGKFITWKKAVIIDKNVCSSLCPINYSPFCTSTYTTFDKQNKWGNVYLFTARVYSPDLFTSFICPVYLPHLLTSLKLAAKPAKPVKANC